MRPAQPAQVGDILIDALAERIANRVAEHLEVMIRSIGAPVPRATYTQAEAAEALGVSVRTIEYMIADGRLGTVTIGSRRLVPASEIARIGSHGDASDPRTPS